MKAPLSWMKEFVDIDLPLGGTGAPDHDGRHGSGGSQDHRPADARTRHAGLQGDRSGLGPREDRGRLHQRGDAPPQRGPADAVQAV